LTYLCWKKGLEIEKIPKERFGILDVNAYLYPKFIENCISEEIGFERIEKSPKTISLIEKSSKKRLLQLPL
jgi:hypothetical protein